MSEIGTGQRGEDDGDSIFDANPDDRRDRSLDHHKEEALHLFGLGEIGRAMHLWQQVLQRDPADERVSEIVEYVQRLYLGEEGSAPPPRRAKRRTLKLHAERDSSPLKIGELVQNLGNDTQRLAQLMMSLERAGNLEGTLRASDRLLELEPDSAKALDYRQRARDGLLRRYLTTLGSLDRLPRLNLERRDIMWDNPGDDEGAEHAALEKAHRETLLARIDGQTPLKELLLLSGIPRFEAARTLVNLLEAQAIMLREGP